MNFSLDKSSMNIKDEMAFEAMAEEELDIFINSKNISEEDLKKLINC